MEQKIIESIVIGFTKALFEEAKTLFDDIYDSIYDEINQFINNGLKSYLEKQRKRYFNLKTILNGNTPVYFYDVYFPLSINYLGRKISTDNADNLFQNHRYITITGDAGSGKSTLMKHLFLQTIKEKSGIPVLIELRSLNNTEENLIEFIKRTIEVNELACNQKILERLLEKGKFIFFLDGYDELNSSKRNNVVAELKSFIEEFNSNKFIITSRPYTNIEFFPLTFNFQINDLSLSDVEGFIHKQLNEEKELANKIVESINQNKTKHIRNFLKNPLLLSLYILTYQSNAEIPPKKHIFYRRVFDALFSEHDSKSKLGYIREKTSKLLQEEFEYLLKTFSFLSFFESKFNFDKDYIYHKFKIIKSKNEKLSFDNQKVIEDLKSAISLWVYDNGLISFTHKSLQEYFAALFIKELNPSEKERMYERIINRFSSVKNLSEIENFLSILQEMDTLYFDKHYYYPLLIELKKEIGGESDDERIDRCLSFFLKEIYYSHKSKIRVFFSENKNRYEARIEYKTKVYRTIYIHWHHLVNLNYELNKIISNGNEIILTEDSTTKVVEENILGVKFVNYKVDLNSSLPIEILNRFKNDNIIKIINSLNEFIDDEITKTKMNINQILENDKDFVDMI